MTDERSPEGLFDDSELSDEERYIVAPGIADYAETLFARHDELSDLRDEIRSGRLAMAYVFDTKPFDPSREDLKPHVMARAYKTPLIWVPLTGCDGAVAIRRWFWDQGDDRFRDALLLHELLHFRIEEPGRFTMRWHDLEEFAAVVEAYGSYAPGRAEFVKAYLRWSARQDQPEPAE